MMYEDATTLALWRSLRRLAPKVRNGDSLWRLAEAYVDDGGIEAIRLATDTDLSTVHGFGRAALKTLRQTMPAPYLVPSPLVGVGPSEDWREYAEMMTGGL